MEATSAFGSQSITGRRHSEHQGSGTGTLKNSTTNSNVTGAECGRVEGKQRVHLEYIQLEKAI